MDNWKMEMDSDNQEVMPLKVKEAYDVLCDALGEAGMDEKMFFSKMGKDMDMDSEEMEDHEDMEMDMGDEDDHKRKKSMMLLMAKKKNLGNFEDKE